MLRPSESPVFASAKTEKMFDHFAGGNDAITSIHALLNGHLVMGDPMGTHSIVNNLTIFCRDQFTPEHIIPQVSEEQWEDCLRHCEKEYRSHRHEFRSSSEAQSYWSSRVMGEAGELCGQILMMNSLRGKLAGFEAMSGNRDLILPLGKIFARFTSGSNIEFYSSKIAAEIQKTPKTEIDMMLTRGDSSEEILLVDFSISPRALWNKIKYEQKNLPEELGNLQDPEQGYGEHIAKLHVIFRGHTHDGFREAQTSPEVPIPNCYVAFVPGLRTIEIVGTALSESFRAHKKPFDLFQKYLSRCKAS